jgi:hypothetical protein
MKNVVFATLVIGFIGLVAFQQHQAKKTYRVEQNLDFWIQATNGLEFTKNQLKQSDLPSKTVSLINDSLLTTLQVEITKQVQAQINAEKPKPEVKKDTTTKPKKN